MSQLRLVILPAESNARGMTPSWNSVSDVDSATSQEIWLLVQVASSTGNTNTISLSFLYYYFIPTV